MWALQVAEKGLDLDEMPEKNTSEQALKLVAITILESERDLRTKGPGHRNHLTRIGA
jgi:hypothetical protein